MINNQPCHRVEGRVTRSDGSVAAYKLWEADDLRHFPIRIQSDSGGKPMTLNFSDVRFDSPAEPLFNPPDGFVKYNNPVALMNELIIRETTVGQHTEASELDTTAMPPRGANIYQPESAR
jgi:hypothetical protein